MRVFGEKRRKRNPEKEAGRLAKRQKISPRNRGQSMKRGVLS